LARSESLAEPEVPPARGTAAGSEAIDAGDAVASIGTAIQELPEDPSAILEAARAKRRQEGPAAALVEFANLRRVAPGLEAGWREAAQCLRELGRLDDAEALLADAVERFPSGLGCLHDLARIFEVRRDWPEAERCWRAFLVLNDGPWWAHTALAAALKEQGRWTEAEQVLRIGQETVPNETGPYVEYARLAEARNDWAVALPRWEQIRVQFPDALVGFAGLARALRQLDRVEEAHSVLVEAQGRFPGDIGLLNDLGRLAERRRDWLEAERCWRAFLALNDNPWWAHTSLAAALREQERWTEAETVLLAAQERLPNESAVFVEYARLAEARDDWAAALARWEQVGVRFPDASAGYAGQARALCRLDRVDEAPVDLIEARGRFRKETGLLVELGNLARRRRDWPEAEQCWRAFLAVNDKVWWAHLSLAVALREQGRIDEAHEPLSIAVEFASSSDNALLEVGHEALRAEAWDVALQCAVRLGEGAQGNLQIVNFISMVQWRLSEVDPEHRITVASLPQADRTSNADGHAASAAIEDEFPEKDLMMSFCSLGGDYPGCEIGLIQRHYGAEPLDLFRWTSTPIEQLIDALESGLAGIGTSEQTELYVTQSSYRTRDKRFFMDMLTFASTDDYTYEKMFDRCLKRISYLREKLLSDLTDGSRIFVYRNVAEDCSEADVHRLKIALQRFGNNKLLYVRLANPMHAVGSVQKVDDNLVFGYVEKFSHLPVERLYLNGWLDVFRAMYADHGLASIC
jgi:tetratricopeptide (TPR) repeat protein